MLAKSPNVQYGFHMNTNTDTTAALVKAAYTKAERSQGWVAKRAGIHPSTFQRRINGGSDFTIPEIARIAQALNIHPSELLPPAFVPQAQSAA